MVYDKKAQLGITLTWMVAFVVIMFVVVVYFIGVGAFSARKWASGSDEIIIGDAGEGLKEQREIYRFLNSESDFGEGKVLVGKVFFNLHKAVKNNDGEGKLKYSEEIKKAFLNLFSDLNYVYYVESDIFSGSFVCGEYSEGFYTYNVNARGSEGVMIKESNFYSSGEVINIKIHRAEVNREC